MFHFAAKRIAVAVVAGAFAIAGPALTSASADPHYHGGGGGHWHGGGGGHWHGGGGGHWHGGHHWHGGGYYGPGYYGPGYYDGPVYYGRPGCVPILGLVSGDFCN